MLGLWLWGLAIAERIDPEQNTQLLGRVTDSVELKVLDLPSGSVGIFDAENDQMLAIFESGEGAFVRGVFRSLVRERRIQGIEAAPTFLLQSVAGDVLVLKDAATGRSVLLKAFGEVNSKVFEDMLARKQRISDNFVSNVGGPE